MHALSFSCCSVCFPLNKSKRTKSFHTLCCIMGFIMGCIMGRMKVFFCPVQCYAISRSRLLICPFATMCWKTKWMLAALVVQHKKTMWLHFQNGTKTCNCIILIPTIERYDYFFAAYKETLSLGTINITHIHFLCASDTNVNLPGSGACNIDTMWPKLSCYPALNTILVGRIGTLT